MMSEVRYFIGVLVVIAIPPAIVWWLVVHPFVSFWRRVGTPGTLTVVFLLLFGSMAGLYIVRAPLMGSDLGTNPLLIGLAVVLLPVAAWVKFKRGKHLTTRILLGVPELQADGKGGKLLTEGPYAVIRHPRYAEIVLGAIAYALFANWSGPYLVTAGAILGLHGVVLLEERELAERFGEEYEAYRGRVPRYIPKLARLLEQGLS